MTEKFFSVVIDTDRVAIIRSNISTIGVVEVPVNVPIVLTPAEGRVSFFVSQTAILIIIEGFEDTIIEFDLKVGSAWELIPQRAALVQGERSQTLLASEFREVLRSDLRPALHEIAVVPTSQLEEITDHYLEPLDPTFISTLTDKLSFAASNSAMFIGGVRVSVTVPTAESVMVDSIETNRDRIESAAHLYLAVVSTTVNTDIVLSRSPSRNLILTPEKPSESRTLLVQELTLNPEPQEFPITDDLLSVFMNLPPRGHVMVVLSDHVDSQAHDLYQVYEVGRLSVISHSEPFHLMGVSSSSYGYPERVTSTGEKLLYAAAGFVVGAVS